MPDALASVEALLRAVEGGFKGGGVNPTWGAQIDRIAAGRVEEKCRECDRLAPRRGRHMIILRIALAEEIAWRSCSRPLACRFGSLTSGGNISPATIPNWRLETVTEPDLIQAGDSGELIAVRKYESTPMTSTFLVVPYRELSKEDGFVLTAYLTNRPSSSRSILWKR